MDSPENILYIHQMPCAAMAMGVSVSSVRNMPTAMDTNTVGASHPRLYTKNADRSRPGKFDRHKSRVDNHRQKQ